MTLFSLVAFQTLRFRDCPIGASSSGGALVASTIAPSSQTGLDFDLEEFLSTFVAANEEYTEKCKAYLRSPSEFNTERTSNINWKWHFSQYNQDWFMFINFFHAMETRGQKGFYVESGANDWIRVSNTVFLDVCLGWEGLCIEPSPKYHRAIEQHRSCTLVKNCLSNKPESILMSGEKPGAVEGRELECVRLDSLLEQHGAKTVNLWSLDVEGFEYKVLGGVDLKKYDVQTLLLEQNGITKGACYQFTIDYRLTTMGYHKYRLVSDGFYVKAGYPQTYSTLKFPDVPKLDEYFVGLEKGRCEEVNFFAPPPS